MESKSPKHLKHKPIISVNQYDKIDSKYKDKTDVRALSIGEAQYNKKEISLKVWRHTGKMWSRQNEELPLHRNIDLNILLLGALMTDINSNYPKTNLREEIDRPDKVQEIIDYYEQHNAFLKPRLEELKDKVNELLK